MKSLWRRAATPLSRAGVAAFILGLSALSVAADLVQISSVGNRWLNIGSSVCVILLLILYVSPILRRGMRGEWLFVAIRRTGLTDVENRGDPVTRLPPSEVFRVAKRGTILISGIHDQFMQRYHSEISAFVREGGRFHIMLVHPVEVRHYMANSWINRDESWTQYWMTNCNEAQIALDNILLNRLDRLSGFDVKFMAELPPYFGTLITTSPSSMRPDLVRIQPLTVSREVGRGSVFTFRQMDRWATPFEHYASDLRSQWKSCVDDRNFIASRCAALGIESRP